MFNVDIKSLVQRASKAHERDSLLRLWQDIADQFYVERADFTTSRYLGEEFASHLYSSYPAVVRRELANAFSGMLRPTNIIWFRQGVENETKLTVIDRRWLEEKTELQRKAMYARRANFNRATKEGDSDFSAFGQCVITTEIDWRRPGLLYRNWHLRDVAWEERYDGSVGSVFRKWKPKLRDLVAQFGEDAMHETNKGKLEKEGDRIINCMVITVPTEDYDYKFKHPWVQIIVDMDNDHRIQEQGQFVSGYTIPRWQTVSGSQYSYSPATTAGLPDARLLQAITLTLLEAGEMYTHPPMIAVQNAIRSDVQLFAGGITIADADYDERLGDVLRPVTQNHSGFPYGFEMAQDIRAQLATAFFLNKLTLPVGDKEMTAYETGERIREYIREALPLFEPMEMEYNGQLCDTTFELMMRSGQFGSPEEIPEGLRNQEVEFKFESPLHDAIERRKGAQLVETKELLEQVVQLDPTTAADLDIRVAFRDALNGLHTPQKWIRPETEANQVAEAMIAKREAAEQAAMLQEAGRGAQEVGAGMEALTGGGSAG